MRSRSDSLAGALLEGDQEPKRFVIISGYHDYRSKRRVNLHFVADELAGLGSVFFLSLRYSWLTRFTEDPRHDLWHRSGHAEMENGVACYLWRTPLHPFRLPRSLALVERAAFALYAKWLPKPARDAVAAADVIFIESGIALVHVPLLRRLNPATEIVYLASDALSAIGQADTIKRAFVRHATLIDRASLPSPRLWTDVPASIPCHFVPHGIEAAAFAVSAPSPYSLGTRNAVSVGSMLFDPEFFRVAAAAYADITFHVIGSGHTGAGPSNVVYHPEMPFAATLPYIKHADFAIAPYGQGVAPYLANTSMKLMQYGFLGVPAVCPDIVVGDTPGRFGYQRDNPASIRGAIAAALSTPRQPPRSQLSWAEVAARWVDPDAFADTRLGLSGRAPDDDRAPSRRADVTSFNGLSSTAGMC